MEKLVQSNAVKCGLGFIKLHSSGLFINLTNLPRSNDELLESMIKFRTI